MDAPSPALHATSPSRQALRIAVVTETYPPEINGVAMTIGRLVGALRQRGHRVQLVRPRQGPGDSPENGGDFAEVLLRGIPIPRYAGLKMGLPAKSALTRLWATGRPDIVHIVTEGPLGWSALAAARKLGIPAVTDFHTNFHAYSRHYGLGWLRRPIGAYLRGFHNRALGTMVPTEGLRRELASHGYRNVLVVARGVDTTLFSPRKRSAELRRSWGAGADERVALYVGRLAPEKNLPLVIEAFAAMGARQPAAKLVLVGDGPQRASLEAKYPEHVFAGMRTGEDLAAHYASADIFLFPSVTETYGNVLMEAMASGLAVVAYDYAAAAEHVVHGQSGLLAEFGNARQFIGLAADLMAGGDIAAMGANAHRTVQAVAWEGIYDKFERILLDMANQEGPRNAQTDLSLEPN